MQSLCVALSEFYASLADGKVKEFTDKQSDAFRNFFRALTLDDLKRKFDGAKDSARAFLEQFHIHIPTLSDFWGLIDSIANGIWNLGEKFQNAASKVANFFAPLFSATGRKFGITFGDLYAFSPTITPILDLSDIDSGIAYLQNEFAGNPELGLRQTWSPDIRGAEVLLSLERPDTDINRVIEEMGYLRGDIVRMGDEISRMKVYLDTDTLVGEMASPMDSALGQSTKRSKRAFESFESPRRHSSGRDAYFL